MQIQRVAPRPIHPLASFDEDYERAVVHLAWVEHETTSERALLFALVELLPQEVPPPVDEGDASVHVGDHAVHLRRRVLPASGALAWYLDCRRGIAVVPDDPEISPESRADAPRLALADLGEEPPWPALVCASGESDTVPFCPPWHRQPRVHHLVPLAPFALDAFFHAAAERQQATSWLEHRLHFSLDRHPDLWGSAHLVAPNPVYRSLDLRLRRGAPRGESVLARFLPRAGRSVEHLELSITDKQPWGPLDVRHVAVHGPLLEFEYEREVQANKHEVVDPERGVLETSPTASVFLRAIHLDVGLVGERLRVEGETPDATYEVQRSGRGQGKQMLGSSPATADVTRAPSGRQRMAVEHFARKARGRAEELDQRWFFRQRQEAADTLRERIHGARREVLIADPELGPDELFAFALAVPRRDIPVRILTAAATLRSPRPQGARDTTLGNVLVAELERVATQRLASIEVRVLGDDQAPQGEAFLLVDDRIWLLGGPLRTFGERATLMLALPDPGPVREHLLDFWNGAVSLGAWVDAEERARAGAPEEKP